MIDREHDLPITKQAEILKVSRGSFYYLPRRVSSADLAIMQRLDRLHLEFPFAGSRMLPGLLALQGCKVGRRHVRTLMRRMGIERCIAGRVRPSPSPAIRSIRICCAVLRSRDRTRSGPWTSATDQWRAALSISPSCWTGRPAGQVHYQWHPLFRRRVRWHYRERRTAGDFVHVEIAPGEVIAVTRGVPSTIPADGSSIQAGRRPIKCISRARRTPRGWLASIGHRSGIAM
jgi:hypothetical protein